jgi:5-hydroxyisourate hydrolase-like protein (transthyretin family)
MTILRSMTASLALVGALAALPAAAQQRAAAAPLPPKLSPHALATYSGKQAAGIRIDLHAVEGDSRKLIKSLRAIDEGRVTENLLNGLDLKMVLPG